MRLNRLFPKAGGRVFAKLERNNPTSVKDRATLNMIRAAIDAGDIEPGTEVVEATSGNTGIAVASLGALLGFTARIYMSESASVERRKLMCAYGATVVLTPAAEHTVGARDRAIAYCQANPDTAFFLNQHGNPDNGEAHYRTTGPELWQQLQGDIGAVVIGMGTCGTLDGLSHYFKEQHPAVKIIGVEPAQSPVFSGGERGVHRINGIGPGMLTGNFERCRHRIDEIMTVTDDDAFDWARRVTRAEGLISAPTSGATLWAAAQLADRADLAGQNIVCFLYDTGERYLSDPTLFSADAVEFEA